MWWRIFRGGWVVVETAGVLPEWWRFEDRIETLGLAVEKGDEESVCKAIDQENLMVRYEVVFRAVPIDDDYFTSQGAANPLR